MVIVGMGDEDYIRAQVLFWEWKRAMPSVEGDIS
jgi:hypothetical protein